MDAGVRRREAKTGLAASPYLTCFQVEMPGAERRMNRQKKRRECERRHTVLLLLYRFHCHIPEKTHTALRRSTGTIIADGCSGAVCLRAAIYTDTYRVPQGRLKWIRSQAKNAIIK